jgi:hypothetical protein
MKPLYKNAKSVILIVILIVFIFYSINTLENFQGNTVNTFLNLPTWMIYLIIIFAMLLAVGSLVVQLYPYILGVSVAKHGINAYFGSKNPTTTREPNNNS